MTEASALIQSDCCVSHNKVFEVHLKTHYQQAPLPYQSTSSFFKAIEHDLVLKFSLLYIIQLC